MTHANDPINAIMPYKELEIDIIRGYPFGLTKREYFAAMAMQGLMMNRVFIESTDHTTEAGFLESVCESAVNAADALINQLNQQP
jgi:hypothetical protein